VIGPIRFGALHAGSAFEVTEVTIASDRLPVGFDGFRLAVLADLHMGRRVGPGFVRRVVEEVRGRRPDAALLLGDMVERPEPYAHTFAELIAPLAEHIPTYAVLGNHEYFGLSCVYRRCIRAAGVDLLVNEHRLIPCPGGPTDGGEPAIALAGLDDLSDGRPSVRAAMEGIGRDTFSMLAVHHPDLVAHLPPNHSVDLVLAGHTHGGQVRLFGWTPLKITRDPTYLGGLVDGPGVPIYVSRGLGMTGLSLRIGADPELPIITLRSTKAVPG